MSDEVNPTTTYDLSRAVALVRAENEIVRIFAKLFTRSTGCSGLVHTIHLAKDDQDCIVLRDLGVIEWWPGPGGWVFTDLGNRWLANIKEP